MSSEVPKSWRPTTLAAACEFFTDGDWVETKDQNPDGEVRLIQLADIGDGAFLDKSSRFLTAQKARELRCSLLEPDDLLIARMADPIARCCLFPGLDQPAATVVDVAIARARKGVDQRFLSYAVSDRSFRELALGAASGTTRSRVSRSNLGALPILLPPLDEQRRIAEVLRSVGGAIEAQEKVCRQLTAAFISTLEACFTAADWPAHPLGDLCESIQVGIVVRPASYYVDSGGIPALRSLNVLENRLALDDLVYISEAGHAANRKSSLRAGDVVTRRTGEPGKTAMIPLGFENGLNCIDIIFSRPKDCLRSAYLSFFMNSDAAKRQVASLQGGLAQQHLNVGEMKKIRVPLPDLQTQDRTVAVLADIWTSMEASRHALQKLSAFAPNLASDLLSGRIRVPA